MYQGRKIVLNSYDRVDLTKTANDAEFYLDWSTALDEGTYKVSYSICKQIKFVIPEIPWVFRVQSPTSTIPTTVDGFTLSNNNVNTVIDSVRENVFNFRGNGFLTINVLTPVDSTKTFWLMMPNVTAGANNTFSSRKMPVWFNGTIFLRASVNFGAGGGGDVISSVAQTSGVWKFYAITTTSTETKIYVDGVLVSSRNVTWGGDSAAINFGAYLGASFLTGLMDDMRLYSSTLTATDINTIYTRTLM